MKHYSFFKIITFAVLLFACNEKDVIPKKNVWKFISLEGNQQTVITNKNPLFYNQFHHDYSFTTSLPKGQFEYTDDAFIGSNIQYNTLVKSHDYEFQNGILGNDTHNSFTSKLYPENLKSSFVKLAQDSIYLKDGLIITTPLSKVANESPAFCAIRITGDTIKIISTTNYY